MIKASYESITPFIQNLKACKTKYGKLYDSTEIRNTKFMMTIASERRQKRKGIES